MIIILTIITSVTLNAIAQLFLKQGANRLTHIGHQQGVISIVHKATNMPIMLGFVCYGLSIFLWIYSLSKVEVSVAYPFQALGYIIVMFASAFFFNETINAQKIIGVLLITAGVICIARQMG